MAALTPMMRQYMEIKEDYKDAFLFFRLGDFYEMFFDDALKASQLLEITLTSREGGQTGRIPMCGVPFHSAASYIETLVRKGYKVAICEQTEDPAQAKGIVKREVIQLITPGTLTEGRTVGEKSNVFIGSAGRTEEGEYALVRIDLSTGEGVATLAGSDEKSLISEAESLKIREIVVPDELYLALHDLARARSILLSVEPDESLPDGGADVAGHCPPGVQPAAARLLRYLERTQKRSLGHIRPIDYRERRAVLSIDPNSRRNLELVQSIRGGGEKGSLYWLLDETVTAMGGRKLRQWIHEPLAGREAILERTDTVGELIEEFFSRGEIRELLKGVYDMERLAGKVAFGNATGRDLAQLRRSLGQAEPIRRTLLESGTPRLTAMGGRIDPCTEPLRMLEEAITDEPPISNKEGGVIREGFNERLDELRDASRNGKDWIAALEAEERRKTGIKSLKIGYNRVFGYYLEVTKSNVHLVDTERFERKQTLANAERYITPELKEKEALILNAEDEALILETELFNEVRERVKEHIPAIQKLADRLSSLDVLSGFAEVSERYRYVRPEFHGGRGISIRNGRHPVVEKMLDDGTYVPNDCVLDEEANMLLITGPNMSGKSTYMRQVALTVIMAQIGCFVPADSAALPVTDQIFTRIGAADDLAGGQSTFMVEMMESRHALAHATADSLLLFDEIGRGTSTYDGMALAQAMMEFIHEQIGANTLFSTHYHELTGLSEKLGRLRNVHVSAAEQGGHVIFLHKVKEGPADKSYGIHVAELAGLPESVIRRAAELLEELESASVPKPEEGPLSDQLSLFGEGAAGGETAGGESGLAEEIGRLDLLRMTPMDAFQWLHGMQEKIGRERS
ncbi:DNA mismatch repair protein MutS [Edaphobacillus lindanitolerans]|uniref:DNA mismatch repair protein MutS n=1 Tax=Edaphobacillus lindanitolerans TaxID=550447 RepID=A0A1U7PIH0_9BACI|nr:DNA mismatch repair protein MutS [Edaphobacillus lindanitolerans]SIT67007.1 DNA mismatch repair protein MutS [Edaphobacillus lindanitolerans]